MVDKSGVPGSFYRMEPAQVLFDGMCVSRYDSAPTIRDRLAAIPAAFSQRRWARTLNTYRPALVTARVGFRSNQAAR